MNEENKELIGNLIGGTTPQEVFIVVDPKIIRTRPLQIGEYVSIEYPKELIKEDVLAIINNLELVNLSIPESLIRSPESYNKLKKLGDLESGERMIASAKILGYFDGKKIIMPRFTSTPGANVYRANEQLLNNIFSRGQINVGHLRAHPNVQIKLDVNELVRRHTAILAITGAGKGNTVAVIATEILKLNGCVIIIDPHEEYPPLRNIYGKKVLVFSAKGDPNKGYFPIKFKLSNFDSEEILDILEIQANATNQRALVINALEELKNSDWDFKDLKNAIDEYLHIDESKSEKEKKQKLKEIQHLKNSQYVVKDKIKMVKAISILAKNEEIPIYDPEFPSLVKKGQISVICLSGLPKKVQQVIVGRIASKLYEAGVAWRRQIPNKQKLPGPVFMVIEEAHNFIPQEGTAKSLFPIRRIAAEGRKFGVGLCVVSQRPGKVHSDVLSQCNSQIILKIINPRDQSQIENSNEAISSDLLDDLPSLNNGEAVITGPSIIIPSIAKIYKFKGELGGDDINILKEWQNDEKIENKSGLDEINMDEVQDYTSNANLIRGKKW
ncbi:MAG: ATP-binding protein [Candidatus Helarchaeota archaeon]